MLGKPHPEQGLIGERLRTARPKLPGWLLEGVGNGAPRGMIVAPPRVTGAGNRTRLTGLSDHLLFTPSAAYPLGCAAGFRPALARSPLIRKINP